jgi:aldehyde dehydrogenase (NAD+)
MHTQISNPSETFLKKISREIDEIFRLQSINKHCISQSTTGERIAKLKKIIGWILINKEKIREALFNDFKKPSTEVDLQEIYVTLIELRYSVRNLKKWMKPKRARRTRNLPFSKSWIQYESKGIVLIITPWNFPFMLTIAAVGSAIAAGNCIMVKPSELTPHTSALMKKMLKELFPANEVAVIEGEKKVAQLLLEKPFNHIFFTGSSQVGKIIMKAAAENLSSITLELGGKSPVIIDETANLDDAAKKIIWGKFLNASQTCVAPDYIFVHESVFNPFLKLLKCQLSKVYGKTEEDRKNSDDYARIIDTLHFNRLKNLLQEAVLRGAKIKAGGDFDEDQRYIAPTLLSNVSSDTKAMHQEIFGPILPLNKYYHLDEVLKIINQNEYPLALYIFSQKKKNIKKILSNIKSGGACINDVVVQFFHSDIPFGGRNFSGIGNTHGFYGFKAFSHERSIVKHNQFSILKLIFPPFTRGKKCLINWMIKYY